MYVCVHPAQHARRAMAEPQQYFSSKNMKMEEGSIEDVDQVDRCSTKSFDFVASTVSQGIESVTERALGRGQR